MYDAIIIIHERCVIMLLVALTLGPGSVVDGRAPVGANKIPMKGAGQSKEQKRHLVSRPESKLSIEEELQGVLPGLGGSWHASSSTSS